MKNHALLLVLLVLGSLLFAVPGTIKLQNSPMAVELLRNGSDGLNVRYAIDELHHRQVNSKEGVWTELSISNYTTTNREGVPSLPLIRQLIGVPIGAEVSVSFVNSDTKTIDLTGSGITYPIIPRQASVAKCEDPASLAFAVNRDFYNSNSWTDDQHISVTELGILRGTRIFALDFAPVRYNPLQKKIEVVYNAEVRVNFSGSDLDATRELKERTYSPAFERNLAGVLFNYEPSRPSLNRYPIGYVIIMPDNYASAMQPFIDWKRREGYNVIVSPTSVTGTTANNIKTYMQNLWNNATTTNPAPSYLLIVGDVAQVPANTGSTGSHPTDLNYVRLQGTDYMPEMYFGRFSATSVAEVTNQVNKTLMHEQYTMPNDEYLAKSVLIAGVDSSYGPSHANGQINYGANNYFNANNGITSTNFMYPASGSSASSIVQNVSNGVGYVNYTAHGSETSWSDPSFTISNINSLQNTNEYSYVVGNCCITNKFDVGTCFGEAWLRASNKGAIIYIGGTNNTYWDEDYYWAVGYKPPVVSTGSPFVANRTGAYDAIFHTHNEAFADWGGNAGSMVLMGNLAVVTSNSSRINYYWEIYSIMGDPSLIPYLGIPQQNSFQAPPQIFLGVGSMDIQADPYTWVSLSMNNVIHGVGLTNESGALTLNFTPFTQPGNAQIVMTRSRRRPLINNIQVIANVGPYITMGQMQISDDNNGIPEAGETISLSAPFNNVGIENATNLSCTLTSESEWVQINTPQISIPDISAGNSVNMSNAYNVVINPNIPDQTDVVFNFIVQSEANTWEIQRTITVDAPNMIFGSPVVFDSSGDGIYQSGETLNVTLDISNTGHMLTGNGSVSLFVATDNAYIDVVNFSIPTLPIDYVLPLNFNVQINETAANGDIVRVGVLFNSGVLMANSSLIFPVGLVGEGFESGTFGAYPWVNTSSSPWTITTGTGNVHSGNYSAKSGPISNYGSTTLQITHTASVDGYMKFWRKVSSETGHDYLTFYINGAVMAAWSGAQDWTEMMYPVSAGTNIYKWTYSKDGSTANGSDCAWIDDVVFPGSGNVSFPMLYSSTSNIDFTGAQPNSTLSSDIIIRNLGNAPLTGTISVPTGFNLSLNGISLPIDYSYQIDAGVTRSYSVSYTTGPVVSYIDEEIMITANDPDNPVLIIPIVVGTGNSDVNISPVANNLDRNYPNPFNPETTIRFSIKEGGNVQLNVYNLKGQLIRSLVNAQLSAGQHRIVWNGKDNNGNAVASGIYLYKMETANYSSMQKMMLMK